MIYLFIHTFLSWIFIWLSSLSLQHKGHRSFPLWQKIYLEIINEPPELDIENSTFKIILGFQTVLEKFAYYIPTEWHKFDWDCSLMNTHSIITIGINPMAQAWNLSHTWSIAVTISHNQSICKPCQFNFKVFYYGFAHSSYHNHHLAWPWHHHFSSGQC